MFGGIKSMFSEASGAFGGGIMGAIGGVASLAGPIGAMVGPAIGMIGKLFSIGGPDIARDVERDLGPHISEGLEKAIEQSGQPVQLAIAKIFEEGFASGDPAATADRLAEEMGDIFSGLEAGEFGAPEAIRALEESVPLLIQHFNELGPAGEEQVQRIIAAAQNMGIEFEGINELISASLGPSITEFANGLDLSKEQAKELADQLGIKLPTEAQKLAAELGTTPKVLKEMESKLSDFGISMSEFQTLAQLSGLSIEELATKLGIEGVEGTKNLAETQEQANANLQTGADTAAILADNLERAALASGGINIPSFGSGELISAQGGFDSGVLSGTRFFPIVAHAKERVTVSRPGDGAAGGVSVSVQMSNNFSIAEPLATAEQISRRIVPVVKNAIERDVNSLAGAIKRKIERS
jgi:hypothetical protein